MSSNYFDQLDEEAKVRYSFKISNINGIDPYSLNNKQKNQYASEYPEVGYFDIVNYLVYNKSAYTDAEFKAYKSLTAYRQFACKWVKDVVPLKIGSLHLVLGKVMHSQALLDKPLEPWFIAEQAGVVLYAHCTCMAGLGEACTHIGALLFHVEHNVRNKISVTSVPAYWMNPGLKSARFAEVNSIDFSTAEKKTQMCGNGEIEQKINQPSPPVPKLNDEQFSSVLKQLHEANSNCAIFNIMKPYNDENSNKNHTENMLILSDLFDNENLKKSFSELQEMSKNVVLKITDAEAALIASETKLQSKSRKWFTYRAGRITASNMKAVCCTKLEKPALSIIKAICYPKKRIIKNAAINWGCAHEKNARKTYVEMAEKKHANFRYETSGFIVNPKYPYFGASPDGIISCDCCGNGCLEIKCPYCLKEDTSKDALLRHTCISNDNGDISLSKKHAYFYQVQMQLFVSEKEYCDFVLWNKTDVKVLRVKKDLEFWKMHFPKMEIFFQQIILPELLGKLFTRNHNQETPKPNIVFL